MIAVTEKFIKNIIHNKQVLKYTNKTCHSIFNKSLKETSQIAQKNKYTGKIINFFKGIYSWGDFFCNMSR